MAILDYELILMLDPQAADDAREKVAADAKSKLESKGEIKHEANWGMRKMAYEIDKRGEADYRFCRFTGGKDLLDELDHSLKITDGVLRFRIFKVDADSPTITPPDTEQIMRRDEDDRGRGARTRPRRSRPATARVTRTPSRRRAAASPPPSRPRGCGAAPPSRPPRPLPAPSRHPPSPRRPPSPQQTTAPEPVAVTDEPLPLARTRGLAGLRSLSTGGTICRRRGAYTRRASNF